MDIANNQRGLLIGGIVLLVILATPFRFILLRSIPFLVLIGLVAWFGKMLWEYWQEQNYAKSIEGNIEQQLTQCHRQIEQIKQEKKTIEENIQDLQTKLDTTTDIATQTWKESLRLVNEFRSELDLRNAKTLFYNTCIKKLKSLLQNHQLAKEVSQKQEVLKQLREKNQDDIADLEALKNNLLLEKSYLETIDQLSLRMLGSTSLQDAKAVQKELETITRELRNL